MDAIDQIRRRTIKAMEAIDDAYKQVVKAQLHVLPNNKRLQETQTFGGLLDKAKPRCDKAEVAMLKYICSQSE